MRCLRFLCSLFGMLPCVWSFLLYKTGLTLALCSDVAIYIGGGTGYIAGEANTTLGWRLTFVVFGAPGLILGVLYAAVVQTVQSYTYQLLPDDALEAETPSVQGARGQPHGLRTPNLSTGPSLYQSLK